MQGNKCATSMCSLQSCTSTNLELSGAQEFLLQRVVSGHFHIPLWSCAQKNFRIIFKIIFSFEQEKTKGGHGNGLTLRFEMGYAQCISRGVAALIHF